MMCAATAGQRGRSVLLVDHATRLAEKIRISGGGRANFTNRDLDPRAPQKHFVGENPNFCRSALSRYTPADFIALVQRHGIAWHEKHKGQLFCDRSADDLMGGPNGHDGKAECRVHHVDPVPGRGDGRVDGRLPLRIRWNG